MNFFSQYIKSIISIGLFAFISEFIFNHFSSSTLTKASKFIVNLCVFTIVFSPIFSLFKNTNFKDWLPNVKDETNISENAFIELTETELEKNLSQNIFQNTGILTESLCIEIECNNDEVKIISIEAVVNSSSETETLEEYINNVLSVNTDTKIKVITNEKP